LDTGEECLNVIIQSWCLNKVRENEQKNIQQKLATEEAELYPSIFTLADVR